MTLKIGDMRSSNNWGDFKIIAICGRRVDIEFILTGNHKNIRKTEAISGNVRDTESLANGGKFLNHVSPQHEAAKITAGTIYDSNFWGQVEVLEYHSSTDIKIKFIESGNTTTVQKYALEAGLVKDLDRQMKETAEKRRSEKAEVEITRRCQEHTRHIKNINYKIQQAHSKRNKMLAVLRKLADKEAKMFAVYKHETYGEYKIESITNDMCIVKFLKTGYLHECPVTQAKRGRVRDYSQYSVEDQRKRNRLKNAETYLENREVLLKKAGEWQKANPEKVSTRNRNRRAKRISAEGTHTKEQTDSLMELQDGKCNCCGVCLKIYEKHLDHIMPLDLGGSNWIDNLQWLCQFCNNSKGAKHPDEWEAEILTDHWKLRRQQRLEVTL